MADLFLLVQVVNAGSFSAAAETMGTTRSLLSRRIIELERRLDVQLLHRNARRFSVTATGMDVYRHASAMCEAANLAERAAIAGDAGATFVRISAQGLLVPMVAQLLTAFSGSHPSIRVTLGSSDGHMESLVRQEADVVLSLQEDIPDSSDIVARRLGRVRLMTVASPDLLKRVGVPTHPLQISGEQTLRYTGDAGPGSTSSRGSIPGSGHPRMASGDLNALLAAVRAGLGFAQLPDYLCAQDLARGQLRVVLEDFEPASLPIHALTMSGRAVGDAALTFVRFIQARYRDMPAAVPA
ncbi:DNA-binding transcriptional LysR family regulator [Luteibacter sp. Sphag1AF]|uniref:LysR family transcriptional regulator n=1 Tax=Luteibacter sp. Sphag1AF TaxID=2587031 RepID=UPI00161A1B7F|nr:LysR family transcriptional regulator [Luteibacter sp. Sphag1AF]MBB3228516.1 DNA-binding transcriptional LysR family regulator [Luteibacter sp. Sphag1AF]